MKRGLDDSQLHGRGTAAPPTRSWHTQWLAVTVTAAAVLTLVDAALLHRKRAYFTGGFLSVDHIADPLQGVAFFVSSLVADAAAIGLPAALVLWICGRYGVGRRLGGITAGVVGLTPFLVADFIGYQLLAYLGDAFDLALMFQLVGGDPEEILAVSSEHLWRLVVAGVIGVVLVAAAVWAIWRWGRRAGNPVPGVRMRQALALPLALVVVSTGALVGVRRASDVLDNGLRRKPTARVLGFVADTASDVDRDGFGILSKPTDPAPFDATIHPYAFEIPGNGIDENGVGGDLPPRLNGSAARSESPRFVNRPNVILIVLESFRADLIGQTVHGQPVTPVLNALAASGASARAYSHNGYTAQSRFHLFTGAIDAPPGSPGLLDDFKANGYETAYFSAQDESFGGKDLEVGFERADVAFDARQDIDNRYTTYTTPGSLGLSFDVLNGHIFRFLDQRRGDRPVFMYVNYYDTHFPYHHTRIRPVLHDAPLPQAAIGPDRREALRLTYLNTAWHVDAAIGELIRRATAAFGEAPAVIVTADHGESLFDEGFLGHGYGVNDAQTRIPFVVAGVPMRIVEPVGQADLRPALLAALSDDDALRSPMVIADASRSVFQYLGAIEAPAQIGETYLDRQLIYDFRTGRAQPANRMAALNELFHRWERAVLRRRAPADVR